MSQRNNVTGSYSEALNTNDQKEIIIQKLRDKGMRITRQRRMLLDIILDDNCSCCKEIYYKALKIDNTIGTATVYRMVNTLEDIGAISRNSTYQLLCNEECACSNACRIEFNDGTFLELSEAVWSRVVSAGLKECGYAKSDNLRSIIAKNWDCSKCSSRAV